MRIFDDRRTREAEKAHQPDTDFSRALQKAFMAELSGFLRRKPKHLLPFEKVQDSLQIWFVRNLGLQTVPLDAIVGSEGRYMSFTRQFLPLKEDLRERWKRVDSARTAHKELPPVELYKVRDVFFVKDGHHRVSVACAKGGHNVEALVYEYECDVPLNRDTDLAQLAIQETYHQFLKKTGLGHSRPRADLQLTLLGGYPILMEHIQAHQAYLKKTQAIQSTLCDAAVSWYDNVYLPLARILRNHHIMRQFPHRTETDFYIWVIQNRRQLIDTEKPYAQTAAELVEAYARKYDRPARKVIGALRRFLGLVRYR